MLIVIAGPTGTGKSSLSLALADRFGSAGRPAEVINADSMQLYRGMNIGTAKVSAAERRSVPHHLFDVLNVTDRASVAAYQRDARKTVLDIQSRGAVPILVGGTGLYISAVIHDLQFPVRDEQIRAELETALDEEGGERLWQRLAKVDPESAAAIDRANSRKVIRALEVIQLTGKPFSARLPQTPEPWQPAIQLFLDGDRSLLRQRLTERSEKMWQDGLVEEVRSLIPLGIEQGVTARQAIGYAQALAFIRGDDDLQHSIEETARLTIRYARRQRSWFARYKDLHRLDYADPKLVDSAVSLAMAN